MRGQYPLPRFEPGPGWADPRRAPGEVRFRDRWGWPDPRGRGRPHYPAPFQQRSPGETDPQQFNQNGSVIFRQPYPPGAEPSRWYQSVVPTVHGQTADVGGTALLQRFDGLPPKTIRPAFTGPMERKMARSCIGRNRAIFQPLELLPAIKRPEGVAVRHSQTPRVRPALVGPAGNRFNKVEDDDLIARARRRAFGSGRLGSRKG
jgi:hypothetical protein